MLLGAAGGVCGPRCGDVAPEVTGDIGWGIWDADACGFLSAAFLTEPFFIARNAGYHMATPGGTETIISLCRKLNLKKFAWQQRCYRSWQTPHLQWVPASSFPGIGKNFTFILPTFYSIAPGTDWAALCWQLIFLLSCRLWFTQILPALEILSAEANRAGRDRSRGLDPKCFQSLESPILQ